MSITTASRSLTRKGRAPNTEARPLVIVDLNGDNPSHTAAHLQLQFLTTRVGMQPAFAIIAAEFVFGEMA